MKLHVPLILPLEDVQLLHSLAVATATAGQEGKRPDIAATFSEIAERLGGALKAAEQVAKNG